MNYLFKDRSVQLFDWCIRHILFMCMKDEGFCTWTVLSVAGLKFLIVSITHRMCVRAVESRECLVAAAKSASDSHIIHVTETCLSAL